MTAQRFSLGARFVWEEKPYEIQRMLPEKKVSIEHIFTSEVKVVDTAILVTALYSGQLKFVVPSKLAKSEKNKGISVESKYISLTECPEHFAEIAKRRLRIVEGFLKLKKEKGKLTRVDVKQYVAEEKAKVVSEPERKLLGSLSISSIYRWASDYLQSGEDLRALIPDSDQCGGKHKARLDPRVYKLIEQVINDMYFKPEVVTIEDVFNEICVCIKEQNENLPSDEKMKEPSRSTIVRHIDALDVAHKFAAKHGKRAADMKFNQYGQMQYPELPLERVEIDHTRSDLIVIDDADNLPLGRLTLTYCIDTATRYILGYYLGFEPYSYYAVMECLYHAIRPKENVREKYGTEHDWVAHGVPSTLVVDNGKCFIGKDLKDACFLLGITLEDTPVKTPYLKPAVERLFGTANTMFFHTLPGTTFSNVQKRGDYDSMKQACIYLSDIDKMMNLFIVDKYAERFHKGLGGIPARRWELATDSGFLPRVPESADQLKILLSRTDKRVIWHYGVDSEHMRYNSPGNAQLARLRTDLKGEKATIKYHPGDMSRIYVYDPAYDSYDKSDHSDRSTASNQRYIELQVTSPYQEYAKDLSLWKHKFIRQAILEEEKSVNPVELGLEKRKIQAIVDAGKERKRGSTRNHEARWNTSGKATRDISVDVQKNEPTANQKQNVSSEIPPVVPISVPSSTNKMDVSLEENDLEGWNIQYINSHHRE